MVERLIVEGIVEARKRGSSVVLETPVLPSTSFSKLSGRDVILKAENLQRTGSFKIRGAMNALSLLDDDQAKRGVVAASAGNHAQGIALAAKTLGIPATVFMPEGAAIPKINATESYGATVKIAGANLGEAVEHARAFESETGARFIHPYDDPLVIAGQGTVGLEVLSDEPDIEILVIPVGGGGLISGSAIAAKALNPDIEIIGVETASYPSMYHAIRGEAGVCGGQTLAAGTSTIIQNTRHKIGVAVFSGPDPADDTGAFNVPGGQVFVLGDHRDNALDSRDKRHGLVPIHDLRYRVWMIHTSLDRSARFISPRWDRFFLEVQ